MNRMPRTQGPPCLDAQTNGRSDPGAGVIAAAHLGVEAGRTLGTRHPVHSVSAWFTGGRPLTFTFSPASIVYESLRILNVASGFMRRD